MFAWASDALGCVYVRGGSRALEGSFACGSFGWFSKGMHEECELGLLDLVGDFGNVFWWCVFSLALALAFRGLFVECLRRSFAYLLVGIGAVDVGGVYV